MGLRRAMRRWSALLVTSSAPGAGLVAAFALAPYRVHRCDAPPLCRLGGLSSGGAVALRVALLDARVAREAGGVGGRVARLRGVVVGDDGGLVGLRARHGRIAGRGGLVGLVRARLGAHGICALSALDAHAPGRRAGAGVGFARELGCQARMEPQAGRANGGKAVNRDRWGRRFSEEQYLSVEANVGRWDQGERESDVFSRRRPISGRAATPQ